MLFPFCVIGTYCNFSCPLLELDSYRKSFSVFDENWFITFLLYIYLSIPYILSFVKVTASKYWWCLHHWKSTWRSMKLTHQRKKRRKGRSYRKESGNRRLRRDRRSLPWLRTKMAGDTAPHLYLLIQMLSIWLWRFFCFVFAFSLSNLRQVLLREGRKEERRKCKKLVPWFNGKFYI